METITLPSIGDVMWVVSPCDTVEQVRVRKVTYIDTSSERKITIKTNAGEYRLHEVFKERHIAAMALINKLENPYKNYRKGE